MCTWMICCIKKHSYILKQLDSVSIDELLALKNVFELMRCEDIKSVLSLNYFIDHAKLNNICISDKQQNLYDINSLRANLPFLVFVNFLTVASRVTINYLHRNLPKKLHAGFLARPLEEPLHDMYVSLIVAIVKALCKQHIKQFSYQVSLSIFDNLSPESMIRFRLLLIKKWVLNYLVVFNIDSARPFLKI